MSILQDLDPKYAKIQRQSSTGNWKLIAWVVSLLLVLTWMSWLIFSLRTGESLSDQGPLKNGVPEQVVTESPPQKIATPPDANPSPIATVAQVEPLPASGGNALIQDARPTAPSALKPAQPESFNQAKTELPAAPPDEPKPAQKKNEAAEKKSASGTTERKQNSGHAHKETSSLAPVVVTKKAAERDIDIITAIVR